MTECAEQLEVNPEVTKILLEYTRNASKFRWNYYVTKGVTDSPAERHEKLFGEDGLFRVASLGLIAEHAAVHSCILMCARSIVTQQKIQKSVENRSIPSQQAVHGGSEQLEVQIEALKTKLRSANLPVEGLRLVVNSIRARSLPNRGSGTSLDDPLSPNKKYNKDHYLYGVQLVIENAVKVTGEPGNFARSYVWPQELALICYVPPEGTENKHATIRVSFSKEMCVSTSGDGSGMLADEFTIEVNPEFAFALTWEK